MSKTDDALELREFAEGQVAFLKTWVGVLSNQTVSPRQNGDESIDNHMQQLIVEKIDEEIRHLEILIPRILTEGSGFAIKAIQSEYAEQLEEIDDELAARERNFRLILSRHRWYTRQLARKIRREGRADDTSLAVTFYEASQLIVFAQQVVGGGGFLTSDGLTPIYSSSASQTAAEGLAKSSKMLFEESVSLGRKLYLKYRVRYLRSFIQRFASEAVVSFLIFILLVEFLLHQFHVEVFVFVVAILALAYVAERFVSAYLRKRRVQTHSRALFKGTRDLYSDYLIFLRARAIGRAAMVDRHKVVVESLPGGNAPPDETAI